MLTVRWCPANSKQSTGLQTTEKETATNMQPAKVHSARSYTPQCSTNKAFPPPIFHIFSRFRSCKEGLRMREAVHPSLHCTIRARWRPLSSDSGTREPSGEMQCKKFRMSWDGFIHPHVTGRFAVLLEMTTSFP